MKRLRWEWLVGLCVGFGLGLAYAWVLAPAPLAGSSPNQLRLDFKDGYRSAVASAYAATGNLSRARSRLELLGEPESGQALVAQAQRALAAGLPFDEAQDLARLASDLQAGFSSITPAEAASPPPEEASPLPHPQSPLDSSSSTPGLTASPRPLQPSPTLPSTSLTPSAIPAAPASPSAPFRRVSARDVCDPSLPAGLLQVVVLDQEGGPFPGIEITVTWNGGEERFFTGLQPEVGAGYADFVMSLDTSYALQIARVGAPVTGIKAPLCPGPAGTSYAGGVELRFQEP